ncbi:MAG: integrase family protein, partial [Mucilaginibacter sp.]|nr:integrase family protein [Mucilaginibacter sp.]
FTGYAFETVYALEPENIFTGVDGGLWITKDRAKSGTEETVPLLPIPLEIIEKYKRHPYCVNENKLLPVNSNQRFNSYLKELADICDINKLLTTALRRKGQKRRENPAEQHSSLPALRAAHLLFELACFLLASRE